MPTLEDVAPDPARAGALGDRAGDVGLHHASRPARAAPGDPDGPEEYHVVILDNGRSAMLGTEFQDMLRCIRCGACMNHCPVYQAVGGHAYGWVYPGPMGAVLTPTLIGVDKAGHLPNASTFCGRCESVCPVRIPLPKLMRHWREREFERHLSPGDRALRPRALGLLRQAPGALPARDAASRCGRSRWLGPRQGPLRVAAARRRLDPAPRLPGAAGRDLPGALEARARAGEGAR